MRQAITTAVNYLRYMRNAFSLYAAGKIDIPTLRYVIITRPIAVAANDGIAYELDDSYNPYEGDAPKNCGSKDHEHRNHPQP